MSKTAGADAPKKDSPFVWQRDRRRAGVPQKGKIPIRGFGSRGDFTLWLLSPIATREIYFEKGKPKVRLIGEAVQDPELNRLRESVIGSSKISNLNKLIVDLVLMEYAATLILRDYNVSDEELAMLLPSKRDARWIEPMIIHALGGEDSVAALSSLAEPRGPTPVIDYETPAELRSGGDDEELIVG